MGQKIVTPPSQIKDEPAVTPYRFFLQRIELIYIYDGYSKVDVDPTDTMIATDAFHDCTTLECITIPPIINAISDRAFMNCSRLITVTLPNTLTTIGDDAFNGCSSLKSITLPLTITTLGVGVFKDCSSLESVKLPPMISILHDHIFCNCVSLTSVHLPENLIAISSVAFEGCSEFISIKGPMFTLEDMLVVIGCTPILNARKRKLKTKRYQSYDISTCNSDDSYSSDDSFWSNDSFSSSEYQYVPTIIERQRGVHVPRTAMEISYDISWP